MTDPASAEATYRPPAFELLKSASDVFDLPQPDAVLWRDQGPGPDERKVDAVLSVGEVAILASAGGFGEKPLKPWPWPLKRRPQLRTAGSTGTPAAYE